MYTSASLPNPTPDCKAEKEAGGWLLVAVAVDRRTAGRQVGSPFRRTKPIPDNHISSFLCAFPMHSTATMDDMEHHPSRRDSCD